MRGRGTIKRKLDAPTKKGGGWKSEAEVEEEGRWRWRLRALVGGRRERVCGSKSSETVHPPAIWGEEEHNQGRHTRKQSVNLTF